MAKEQKDAVEPIRQEPDKLDAVLKEILELQREISENINLLSKILLVYAASRGTCVESLLDKDLPAICAAIVEQQSR